MRAKGSVGGLALNEKRRAAVSLFLFENRVIVRLFRNKYRFKTNINQIE